MGLVYRIQRVLVGLRLAEIRICTQKPVEPDYAAITGYGAIDSY